MVHGPIFATTGKRKGDIEVRLSYRIVELFSEGLYASPNKAVEELVANSFDAGAQNVHVLLSSNLSNQGATIAVVDDGEGMDGGGLKRHWFIGVSNKRELETLPRNRQQIGKFGIGKLATYVLANRLTHISKFKNRYYSASIDYLDIKKENRSDVESRKPIKIALRELTVTHAKKALRQWTDKREFKKGNILLFGKGSPASWTVSIMSSLKDKAGEIKLGTLEWVLRTALPLRPDFKIWLNGEELIPSKKGKGILKKWVLGKDLIKIPKPSSQEIEDSEDQNTPLSDVHHYGLTVPGLGRVTGYAEAYKDLLTGKSDQIGRSYGFFVYAFGRLLNVTDGHFGISPNELRHGTFGRFRLVIHIDKLDEGLRSNRETISEGPLLEAAQNLLRGIFNAARSKIEEHDRDEKPGAKLSRKIAAGPASLSRRPILNLAKDVSEGKKKSRYLIVPKFESGEARKKFLDELEQRVEQAEKFVTDTSIDSKSSEHDEIAKFDTESGSLRLNALHPFVNAFQEASNNKKFHQLLELFVMAEVLAEAHLHYIGVKAADIDEFLSVRDQLLRSLAERFEPQSPKAVARALGEARNDPVKLEECVCNAFHSLGFEVSHLGGRGKPDGVATAYLSAQDDGGSRQYKVSLEAKSKQHASAKVAAQDVGISKVARHRTASKCDHAVVVGPAFQISGKESALEKEIAADRKRNNPHTITLIHIEDLARLVRLRPVKRVGLSQLRELFQRCSLPEESAKWVDSIREISIDKPPYRKIVETIHKLQTKFDQAPVSYGELRVELSHLRPPIKYQRDSELAELCQGMAQMAPGAMFAHPEKVELDQSVENVMAAIETATNADSLDEE